MGFFQKLMDMLGIGGQKVKAELSISYSHQQ
jgi:hypothetical protein